MKKLFDGKVNRLCVDQFGDRLFCRTVKELKEKVGRKRADKIYIDRLGGGRKWVGYVVGGRWFSVYQQLGIDV
jgi:hypothetical protein